MEYAGAVALPGRNRRVIVAFFSIGSFVVIFVVAILWATRPVSESDAARHGTREQSESLTHPGQQ
jgi:hypothetical protein